MDGIQVVVVGAPGLADALVLSERFSAVHRFQTTSQLRSGIAALSAVKVDQIAFLFADNAPNDIAESSVADLVGKLSQRGYRVVVVECTAAGRVIVQQHPGAGLLPAPTTLNVVLGALSDRGMGMLEPVTEAWAYASIDPTNPDAVSRAQAQTTTAAVVNPFSQPSPTAAGPWGAQPDAVSTNPAAAPWETQPAAPTAAVWEEQVIAPLASPWETQPAPTAAPWEAQPTSPWGAQPAAPTAAPWEAQPTPTATPTGAPWETQPAPAAAPTGTPWETQPTSPWGAQPAAPTAAPWEAQPAPTAAPTGAPWQTQNATPTGAPWGAQPAAPTAAPWEIQPAAPAPAAAAPWEVQPASPWEVQPAPAETSTWGPQPQDAQAGSYSLPVSKRKGLVISVCVAKGGAGKSSLTLNLGVWLGLRLRAIGQSVCIVDANWQQADIGKQINAYNPNIAGLSRHPEDMNPQRIAHHLYSRTDLGNTSFLLGPSRTEDANPLWITPTLYSQAVENLRYLFDYVLIDTPVAEFHHELFTDFVIPRSDYLVVPVIPNLSTIMNTDSWLRAITTPIAQGGLGYDEKRIGIILNRAEADVGFDEEDVLKELSAWDYLGPVPDSKEWRAAANHHDIVATRNYPEINHAFARILHRITGEGILLEGLGDPNADKVQKRKW